MRWTVEGNWVWPKNNTKLNDKNKIKDLNNIRDKYQTKDFDHDTTINT